MTGSVIERCGHRIDEAGRIHYDERPATWEAADKLAGRRVDRRRCYAIITNDQGRPELCEAAHWTDTCSGCTEYGAYGTKYVPSGCEECGYTGRRRRSMWVPHLPREPAP